MQSQAETCKIQLKFSLYIAGQQENIVKSSQTF